MSPITFVVLFLVLVGAVAYALVCVGRWAIGPNKRRILKPGLKSLGVAAVVWSAAFLTVFATSSFSRPAGITAGLLVFAVVLCGGALTARMMPTGGAIVCGLVMVGAVWAVLLGDYAAHAIGWQDLSLDDLGTGDHGAGWLFVVGGIFFAPQAFIIGFLTGLISPRLIWRRRPTVPAAQ